MKPKMLRILLSLLSISIVSARSLPEWRPENGNSDPDYCTLHSPCSNGGRCLNGGLRQYSCICPRGYGGVNCEGRTNTLCEQQGICSNGGKCVPSGSSNYKCICPPGYEGLYCQIKERKEEDMCKHVLCQNGGLCVSRSLAPLCLCPDGYTGVNCEMVVHVQMSTITPTSSIAQAPPTLKPRLLEDFLYAIQQGNGGFFALCFLVLTLILALLCARWKEGKKVPEMAGIQTHVNNVHRMEKERKLSGTTRPSKSSRVLPLPIPYRLNERYTLPPKSPRSLETIQEEEDEIYDEVDVNYLNYDNIQTTPQYEVVHRMDTSNNGTSKRVPIRKNPLPTVQGTVPFVPTRRIN